MGLSAVSRSGSARSQASGRVPPRLLRQADHGSALHHMFHDVPYRPAMPDAAGASIHPGGMIRHSSGGTRPSWRADRRAGVRYGRSVEVTVERVRLFSRSEAPEGLAGATARSGARCPG
jgi:hypothetical protein